MNNQFRAPYVGSGISLIVGKAKFQSVEEFGPRIESTDIKLREISKASRGKAYVNTSASWFLVETYCTLMIPSDWLFRT